MEKEDMVSAPVKVQMPADGSVKQFGFMRHKGNCSMAGYSDKSDLWVTAENQIDDFRRFSILITTGSGM